MYIQLIKDGEKNFSVLVRGWVEKDFNPVPIINIEKLVKPTAGWKGVRLDSVVWAIQEKMGFHLWWENEYKEENLILPLESRNAMRFDEGIPSPRVAQGWKKTIWLSSFKTLSQDPDLAKHFFILLDFDKQ
jgi:hypothetical protein